MAADRIGRREALKGLAVGVVAPAAAGTAAGAVVEGPRAPDRAKVFPPLMVMPASDEYVIDRPTALEMKRRLRESIRAGDPVIFSSPVVVYQLIDGRWEPVEPAAGATPVDAVVIGG
jgi:hypothetical protein